MIQCFDIFKNINIVAYQNNVSISPCCLAPVSKTQVVDFIDNTYLASFRQQIQKGEFPVGCSACQQAESAGLTSRRIGSNQWYKDNGLDNNQLELVRMDYWTGDTCNLACVICGPNNSSVWKQELGLPIELQKSTTNKFWHDIQLDQIKFIHFNGGEPLLSKEHVRLLEAVPDKSQVHINYNTNGTVLPTQYLLDLWAKFKLVQLDFSIDDIKQRFQYQRYPAIWQQVVDNLNWFVEHAPHNCMFAINTSVGVLNFYNLNNLDQWLLQNFRTSRFTDPVEYRQQFTAGIFSLKNAHSRKNDIVAALNKIDQRRGTDWKKTFPELLEDWNKIFTI